MGLKKLFVEEERVIPQQEGWPRVSRLARTPVCGAESSADGRGQRLAEKFSFLGQAPFV